MTKTSRRRRTNAQIAAANEAELQHLKQLDTSGWSVKRRESHEADIDKLIGRDPKGKTSEEFTESFTF